MDNENKEGQAPITEETAHNPEGQPKKKPRYRRPRRRPKSKPEESAQAGSGGEVDVGSDDEIASKAAGKSAESVAKPVVERIAEPAEVAGGATVVAVPTEQDAKPSAPKKPRRRRSRRPRPPVDAALAPASDPEIQVVSEPVAQELSEPALPSVAPVKAPSKPRRRRGPRAPKVVIVDEGQDTPAAVEVGPTTPDTKMPSQRPAQFLEPEHPRIDPGSHTQGRFDAEEDEDSQFGEEPTVLQDETQGLPQSSRNRRRRNKRPSSGGRLSPEGAKEALSLQSREILISAAKDETRVALVEDGAVVEFYVERPSSQKIAGSIFLGKTTNVLPGMQAAFIDIGEEKNAFLYVDDAILPPNLEDAEGIAEVTGRRKKTISELVKPGQEVMVQVVKEAIGTKGARVTRHVTFPGRYMVLMPTVSYVGVSRRIVDDEERKRLRQIARDLKPKDMGIIIRTVAEKKTKEELERDLQFLLKVWEKVRKRAQSQKAPSLVHSDMGLAFRVVRDELNQETTRMLVDDVDTYSRVLDLLESTSPEMKDRVIYYRDRDYPLFQLYGVDAAVEKALGRQVWLKSGGYLVIDKTEALTVIDVNTGRYVGSKNLSDTVFKINMEACEEIARQLRIRDIGGIIVVDFIDMEVAEHRQKLLLEMEKQLRHDHTKTVVVGLTGLGLVEMTRKKVRQSIDAVMMRMCPYCGGKGVILSEETVAGRVRREIRRLLRNSQCEAVLLEVHPGVASHLIGPSGTNLRELEKETNRAIFVRGTDKLHLEEMNVKALGSKDEIAEKAIPVQIGDVLEVTIEEAHDKNPSDGIARREGFVIDVEGAGNKVGQKLVIEVTQARRTYAKGRPVA